MALRLLRLLAVVVANTALGMTWYSTTYGFGKIWKAGHDLSDAKISARARDPTPMIVATFTGAIQAYFAERLLDMSGASGVAEELSVLVEIWFAFTFIAIAMHSAFVAKHWATVTLIDGVFNLAQLGTLVLIRHYVV